MFKPLVINRKYLQFNEDTNHYKISFYTVNQYTNQIGTKDFTFSEEELLRHYFSKNISTIQVREDNKEYRIAPLAARDLFDIFYTSYSFLQ